MTLLCTSLIPTTIAQLLECEALSHLLLIWPSPQPMRTQASIVIHLWQMSKQRLEVKWLVQGYIARFRSLTLNSIHELSNIQAALGFLLHTKRQTMGILEEIKQEGRGGWRTWVSYSGPPHPHWTPLGLGSVALSPEHSFLCLWSLRSSGLEQSCKGLLGKPAPLPNFYN